MNRWSRLLMTGLLALMLAGGLSGCALVYRMEMEDGPNRTVEYGLLGVPANAVNKNEGLGGAGGVLPLYRSTVLNEE